MLSLEERSQLERLLDENVDAENSYRRASERRHGAMMAVVNFINGRIVAAIDASKCVPPMFIPETTFPGFRDTWNDAPPLTATSGLDTLTDAEDPPNDEFLKDMEHARNDAMVKTPTFDPLPQEFLATRYMKEVLPIAEALVDAAFPEPTPFPIAPGVEASLVIERVARDAMLTGVGVMKFCPTDGCIHYAGHTGDCSQG